MDYDLIVRNGTVVDGSGRPRYRADVAVSGGRIRAIGRIRDRGADEVDAEGRFVAPGFIDGHTHLDAQMCWDPLGTCDSWHGITTVVMGNCGFTVAPSRDAEKHLALRSLERAEDISSEVLEAGLEWRWETYADYLDVLDRLPKGINVAGYIGHSALRPYVMGEAAFERPATPDDVAAMSREVESAMRAGAMGLSTSRSPNHATTTGGPVASRVADWSEVQALVGVMGRLGAGIFQLAQEQHADPVEYEAYRQRLRTLAVESGRQVLFTIGTRAGGVEEAQPMLDYLAASATAGARMTGCVHTREFTSVLGFRVVLPFDQLPEWAELRHRPLAEQAAVLSDPDRRRTLAEVAMHGPYGDRAIGAEARPPQWDQLRVLDTPEGPWRTVAEIARERGTTPADAMIDLSLAAGFDLYFSQPFANLDLDAVLASLRSPYTVIAISDTGAHVGQLLDSSIPTHLLAYWVRQRQAFTWEEAVRMLTFDPAGIWGFRDRGLVHEGMVADLVVFDPETVAPGLPETRYDQPGGFRRLVQPAVGIDATVVDGRVLLRDGVHTGAVPGRLLRGPLAAAAPAGS